MGNLNLAFVLLAISATAVSAEFNPCPPSTDKAWKCQRQIGGEFGIRLRWRAIEGGVRIQMSVPGEVWIGFMFPSVAGQMNSYDPKATAALDTPKPSISVVASQGTSGRDKFLARVHVQNGVPYSCPVVSTNRYDGTFNAILPNGAISGSSVVYAKDTTTMEADLNYSYRFPCDRRAHPVNVAYGYTTNFAYHAHRYSISFIPSFNTACPPKKLRKMI